MDMEDQQHLGESQADTKESNRTDYQVILDPPPGHASARRPSALHGPSFPPAAPALRHPSTGHNLHRATHSYSPWSAPTVKTRRVAISHIYVRVLPAYLPKLN
jgi:hypothetical protein